MKFAVGRTASLTRSCTVNLRYAFLLIAAFSSPLGLTSAFAQSGTVTIVVPFTPGTVPDYLSRLLGDQLKDRIGHPVVTDNRAGASGNLGTFRVARAEPDGNTLLMSFDTFTINGFLFKAVPDPLRRHSGRGDPK